MKPPLLIPPSRMAMLNAKIGLYLIVFAPFHPTRACLHPCLLKPLTTLFTPKTATPPAHSPTLHHMKSASIKNLISLDFVHSVVSPMSMTTHPNARSYRLELLKASLLGMQIHRRPIGFIFRRRGH